MKRFSIAVILMVFGLALLVPTVAGAQDNQGDTNLVVLQTVTSEDDGGAQLKVYVTLRDRNGEPIQDGSMASINEGSVTLGSDRVNAAVASASDPIKIALVI